MKVAVDSNIIVAALKPAEKQTHRRCRELIHNHWSDIVIGATTFVELQSSTKYQHKDLHLVVGATRLAYPGPKALELAVQFHRAINASDKKERRRFADAWILAEVAAAGVEKLYTLNLADFSLFDCDVEILTPPELLQAEIFDLDPLELRLQQLRRT